MSNGTRLRIVLAAVLTVGVIALFGAFGARGDILAHLPGGTQPRIPNEADAEVGTPYRFELLTHCGIERAHFDGRWWEASPKLYADDGVRGNPPAGWPNPTVTGTMTLLAGEEKVRFASDEGQTVMFVPGDPPGEAEMCA